MPRAILSRAALGALRPGFPVVNPRLYGSRLADIPANARVYAVPGVLRYRQATWRSLHGDRFPATALYGLGDAVGDSLTDLQAALAQTEQGLIDLRASIVAAQDALRASGGLQAAVDGFHHQRNLYASFLSGLIENIRSQLQNLDQLQKDETLGFWGGSRAKAFDAQLMQEMGSLDPGLALIQTLPPIKGYENGSFAGLRGGSLAGALGLAPLVTGALVGLIIIGVAIGIGAAIRLSGLTRTSQIQAGTAQVAQFVAAAQAGASPDVLAQLAKNLPKPAASGLGGYLPWVIGAGLVIFFLARPELAGSLATRAARATRTAGERAVRAARARYARRRAQEA